MVFSCYKFFICVLPYVLISVHVHEMDMFHFKSMKSPYLEVLLGDGGGANHFVTYMKFESYTSQILRVHLDYF